MRKLPFLPLLAVIAAACSQPQQQGSISGQLLPPQVVREYSLPASAELVPGEAIVKFRHGVTAQSVTEPLNVVDSVDADTKVVVMPGASLARAQSASLAVKAADAQASSTLAWIKSLRSRSDVEYAVANTIYHPLAVGNPLVEPFYTRSTGQSQKWNYDLAKVPQAWAVQTGHGGVLVAVLDTGILPHLDFNCTLDNGAPKIVQGYDFVKEDADPYDDGPYGSGATGTGYHGTHVAGTIGACANGSQGTGVAPGVQLMPVRVLDANGGRLSDVARAIRWAVRASGSGVATLPDKAADVINLSLGSDEPPNPVIQDAIDAANAAGAVVVVAAGNESQNAVNLSPANQNGVVVVGATGGSGTPATYSNHGGTVSLVAPGGSGSLADGVSAGVLSTLGCGASGTGSPDPNPPHSCGSAGWGYGYHAGTSMAAPHVSGTVALMMSEWAALADPTDPQHNWARVMAYLQDSATPVSNCTNGGCGAGLLNAGAAVGLAQAHAPMKAFLSPATHFYSLATTGTTASIDMENIGDAPGSWSLKVFGPGLSVSGATSLSLNVGEAKTVSLSLNRASVPDGVYYGRLVLSDLASPQRVTEVVIRYEQGSPSNVGALKVRATRVANTDGSPASGPCKFVEVIYPYDFNITSLGAGIYDLEAYHDTNKTSGSNILTDMYGTRSSVVVGANERVPDESIRLDYYSAGQEVSLPATCR